MYRTSNKDMTSKSQFSQYITLSDSLEGLNSGVPTRTTATLTPTTLRSVEQTFLDIPGQGQVEVHQNQARFVPPPLPTSHQVVQKAGYMSVVDTKSWQGGSTRVASDSLNTQVELNTKPAISLQPRRNVGGRRPIKDKTISPEEEQRRAVRRERNKLAAARCRKRRLDHTNELMIETDGLQKKKSGLQNEIQQLKMQKEELEYLLETHRPCCRIETENNEITRCESPPDIKPFHTLKVTIGKEDIETKKLSINLRPTSLPVQTSTSVLTEVPITTPTGGVLFNFDSLMEGGTGLTPVSGPLAPSSCSTQQRHHIGTVNDLASPDSSSKLVSL